MEEQEKILVVDDEESVRNLLQRTLTEAGYNVTTAANGNEALDKMSQFKIGVVLLDVNMPGMSGIEVLRQLSVNWPEVCVIMATAITDAQTAVEAMKLGAYDYITKPFNRDEVVLSVQRAIEKRHLLAENERHQFELQKRVGEQAARLQEQFVDLVETLAREHKLIYKLAYHEGKRGREALSKLPKELHEPMASVEEFSEALLKLLRGGLARWSRTSTDDSKGSKQ